MKICVFLPNWIGDLVMATPALRALRSRYPSAHVTGIQRPYLTDVLAGTSWLDEFWHYHPKSKDKTVGAQSLLAKMRGEHFDIALLMTNSFRPAALSFLAHIPSRVGFVRYGRGLLLTHKLYAPRRGWKYLPTPAIDSYLQLTGALGCSTSDHRLELATCPNDELAADAVWRRLGLPEGDRVVVLNSGGAYGAAKHWPAEYFGELAARITRELGYSVLVNCGPAEREIARKIVGTANDSRVVSLAEEAELPIGLSKAVVRRSRLLVSTDSGPRFFAPAFGVPVVSLFGPTHIDWSRTDDPLETCLAEDVPCGPCMQRSCPLGTHACMRNLSVSRVFAKICARLADSSQIVHAA
jgi:heptosyltransferase-2